jgi:hypothetical protein
MAGNVFGEFPQRSAIAGRFAKDYELALRWLPEYMEEFPAAVKGIALNWESCKFVPDAQILIPEKHGVYCFSVNLGPPFPEPFHVPLYIGAAPNQYLSERFRDYFAERGNTEGRKKVVQMLNKYKGRLVFWWAPLARVYVETVEQHLLMCCMPPCNEKFPDKERFWGRAFE